MIDDTFSNGNRWGVFDFRFLDHLFKINSNNHHARRRLIKCDGPETVPVRFCTCILLNHSTCESNNIEIRWRGIWQFKLHFFNKRLLNVVRQFTISLQDTRLYIEESCQTRRQHWHHSFGNNSNRKLRLLVSISQRQTTRQSSLLFISSR